MTRINVYIKKDGMMKHSYLHWRQVQRLFKGNFTPFDGVSKEFLLVDIDDKKILNSSAFFTLMDLPFEVSEKIAKNYTYEEI